MKKRIQKQFSIVIMMLIIATQSLGVNASSNMTNIDSDKNAPDAVVAPKTEPVTYTFYEYDIVKEYKTEDEINEILLYKIKNEAKNSNIYNLALSNKQLFNKEFIATLSDDIKRGYWASCDITHKINFHAYLPSMNKTVAYIDFNWSWDFEPEWRRTDMIGFGWDAIMHKAESEGERHLIKYYTCGPSCKYVTTKRQQFTQYEGNCLSDKIDMQTSTPKYSWAKEGSGEFKLDAAGEVSNLGVSYKYGHQKLGVSPPFISYPFGIGFTIKNVQDTTKSELAVSHLY
jgi:hypothetical protein